LAAARGIASTIARHTRVRIQLWLEDDRLTIAAGRPRARSRELDGRYLAVRSHERRIDAQ